MGVSWAALGVVLIMSIRILRTVESYEGKARQLPFRLDKRLFQVLMAMACHAGENAYAALSTMLQGEVSIGTPYSNS
jgi:hypothetical protein